MFLGVTVTVSDMDKQSENQAITEYLLGSLPEAEAAHFDELSISDDDLAETLRAAEKELVDAYALGELSGSQLERFESYYLASPLRREKVQLALAFQALGEASPFLRAGEVQKEKPTDSVKNKERWHWLSALGFSEQLSRFRLVGAVAALIVMILAGWLVFQNIRLRSELSQTVAQRDISEAGLQKELAQARDDRDRFEQELKLREIPTGTIGETSVPKEQPGSPSRAVSIASFVLKPQMRSLGQITTISIPDKTTHTMFRLELEPNDYSAYKAALLNNDQTLWQSGTLRPSSSDATRFVRVSLGAHLLKAESYILRVSGVSSSGASEILGDYPFRVVK